MTKELVLGDFISDLKNLSLSFLAKKYDCSISTIKNYRKQYGIKIEAGEHPGRKRRFHIVEDSNDNKSTLISEDIIFTDIHVQSNQDEEESDEGKEDSNTSDMMLISRVEFDRIQNTIIEKEKCIDDFIVITNKLITYILMLKKDIGLV